MKVEAETGDGARVLQELEEAGSVPALEPPGGPLPTPHFGLPASRTCSAPRSVWSFAAAPTAD